MYYCLHIFISTAGKISLKVVVFQNDQDNYIRQSVLFKEKKKKKKVPTGR